MVASINLIDASQATDNANTDEPDGALDYSHANTDNDENFQEGKSIYKLHLFKLNHENPNISYYLCVQVPLTFKCSNIICI